MTPPSHPDLDLQAFRDQAHRYMVAVYGTSYVFTAPEAFHNILVRWIWAVASGEVDFAEKQMAKIETMVENDRASIRDNT